MKYILSLSCLLTLLACEQPAAVPVADTPDTETQHIAEHTDPLPFIHTVFFWETEGLSETASAALRQGIETLRTVPSVGKIMIGGPAGSEQRDVVDHSYDHALIVHFTDQAAHDAYQTDPIHLKFVEDHKDKWQKVVVYDSVVE